jgi:hypothetical protein
LSSPILFCFSPISLRYGAIRPTPGRPTMHNSEESKTTSRAKKVVCLNAITLARSREILSAPSLFNRVKTHRPMALHLLAVLRELCQIRGNRSGSF